MDRVSPVKVIPVPPAKFVSADISTPPATKTLVPFTFIALPLIVPLALISLLAVMFPVGPTDTPVTIDVSVGEE